MRAKGTAWESALERWLKPRFPFVEKRRQHGVNDRGDIAGLAGVVIEAKNVNAAGMVQTFSTGLKELQAEVDNAHASLGLLCIKRPGYATPDGAYWLVDPRHVQNLIAMVDMETRGAIRLKDVGHG